MGYTPGVIYKEHHANIVVLFVFEGRLMQSSLISKIEKAKRYAQEKDRVSFSEFSLNFRGEHDNHTVNYHRGKWHCTCNFFSTYGQCSHRMAMEKILGDMLPRDPSHSSAIVQPALLGLDSLGCKE